MTPDSASAPLAADRRQYRFLTLLTALFVTALITANILAVKPVAIAGLLFPAAIVVFPVSYILGDVLTEVYGYARARQVIWIGFGCNVVTVAAIAVAARLPAAAFWGANEPAFATILGSTPRILAASFAAYLVGEFLNAIVLARMKVATRGRWLWSRTIGSTLVGELADSAVFITAAFAGVWPSGLLTAIVTQWLLKSGYEVIATPLTYGVVGFLKRAEREDYYDERTDFSPLHLNLPRHELARSSPGD